MREWNSLRDIEFDVVMSYNEFMDVRMSRMKNILRRCYLDET